MYPTGTRLMIELSSGKTYEGKFNYGDNKQITLSHVSEYPDNIKYENLFHFYKMEIVSITVLIDVEELSPIKPKDSNVNADMHKLQELTNKHKYISEVNNSFHAAIGYLKICTKIAVFGFGCAFGRRSKISLLAIGTKNEIFIFDIQLCGEQAFDSGLKNILESNDVSKTVHDCRPLADCLYHIYRVSLKNVFDTQVADYMIVQKHNGTFPEKMRIFTEIVDIYLQIPIKAIKNNEINEEQSLERPLSDKIKLNTALQVAYLNSLRDILCTRMLFNLCLSTEHFLNCMKDEEDETNCIKLLKLDVPFKVKELTLTL